MGGLQMNFYYSAVVQNRWDTTDEELSEPVGVYVLLERCARAPGGGWA